MICRVLAGVPMTANTLEIAIDMMIHVGPYQGHLLHKYISLRPLDERSAKALFFRLGGRLRKIEHIKEDAQQLVGGIVLVDVQEGGSVLIDKYIGRDDPENIRLR